MMEVIELRYHSERVCFAEVVETGACSLGRFVTVQGLGCC